MPPFLSGGGGDGGSYYQPTSFPNGCWQFESYLWTFPAVQNQLFLPGGWTNSIFAKPWCFPNLTKWFLFLTLVWKEKLKIQCKQTESCNIKNLSSYLFLTYYSAYSLYVCTLHKNAVALYLLFIRMKKVKFMKLKQNPALVSNSCLFLRSQGGRVCSRSEWHSNISSQVLNFFKGHSSNKFLFTE